MLHQNECALLRPSGADDVEALEALFVRAFRARCGAYSSLQVEAAIAAGIGRAPELFAAGQGVVAELGGRLAGSAAWSLSPHIFPPGSGTGREPTRPGEATLRAVCVAPEAAGRGIGARLIEAVIADAVAAGATGVWLLATAGSVSFYARNGFVLLDRFEVTLDSAVSLPVASMRRPLGGGALAEWPVR